MISDRSLNISTDEVVSFLKTTLQYQNLSLGVLHQLIVKQAAKARGIIIEPYEIREAADRQRRERQLAKASDTFAWLLDQQVTPEAWEAGICDRLLMQKLKETLFEAEVESYFAQNRLDFDQILLYQIIVPDEQLADELFYQIEESQITFLEATYLHDNDVNRRQNCGYEGKLYRWSLKPEIAALAFTSTPGSLLYPIQTEHGFHLLRIEKFIRAQLNAAIRQEILQRLFQDWLKSELNDWFHSHTLGE